VNKEGRAIDIMALFKGMDKNFDSVRVFSFSEEFFMGELYTIILYKALTKYVIKRKIKEKILIYLINFRLALKQII
jgi:hypothetical protein